jgi:transposase InsO family protein
MGGSRTVGHDIREKHTEFRLEGSDMSFRHSKSPLSDNGKQFDNPKFKQFSEELGIHNHYSSPGHPQANE